MITNEKMSYAAYHMHSLQSRPSWSDQQKNEVDNQGCEVPTVGTGRTFDECMVRKHKAA